MAALLEVGIKRTMTVLALGGAAGAVLGLMVLALFGGFIVTDTVGSVVIDSSRSIARPILAPTTGALYLLVIVTGAAGGALISVLTIALAGYFDPDDPRFRPSVLVVAGATLGAVVAYALLRAGIGWGGSIVTDSVTGAKIVTLSVYRATWVAVGVGAGSGMATALGVERLSRTAVLGLEGEAWPTSRLAFMREATPAMLIPVVALLGAVGIVFAFSRLLLAGAEENVVAVTIFSVAAAAILGGAAFIASHPPRGGEPPEEG